MHLHYSRGSQSQKVGIHGILHGTWRLAYLVLDLFPRRFRALVQVVVISCKLNKLESLGSKLDDLFTIMDSVTRNEASDGLNQVLDAVCAIVLLL